MPQPSVAIGAWPTTAAAPEHPEPYRSRRTRYPPRSPRPAPSGRSVGHAQTFRDSSRSFGPGTRTETGRLRGTYVPLSATGSDPRRPDPTIPDHLHTELSKPQNQFLQHPPGLPLPQTERHLSGAGQYRIGRALTMLLSDVGAALVTSVRATLAINNRRSAHLWPSLRDNPGLSRQPSVGELNRPAPTFGTARTVLVEIVF